MLSGQVGLARPPPSRGLTPTNFYESTRSVCITFSADGTKSLHMQAFAQRSNDMWASPRVVESSPHEVADPG
jgi:hypothetical protein